MIRISLACCLVAVALAPSWAQVDLPTRGSRQSQKRSPASSPESRKQILASYRWRAATLRSGDLAGHLQLALFLRQHHFPRTARRELRQVIKIDPEHAQARKLLGYERLGGKWLTPNQAHLKRGHVRYKGQWYSKEAASRQRANDREKLRLRKLQRDVKRLVRRLAGSSEKRRLKARDDMIVLARKEKLPQIAQAARLGYKRYKAWWAAYRQATLELRATHTTLTGLRSRSLSLGTGSPVRIELPELKRVSIATTVRVPVGRK